METKFESSIREIPYSQTSVYHRLSDLALSEEVREAVAMLPPDERDIFIMWMEGFKTGEIAEVMSMTYGNVAIKLTRIKLKLRKMLNPKKEDEL